LNGSLAQLYYQFGATDLARERFDLVVQEALKSGMSDESVKQLTKMRMEAQPAGGARSVADERDRPQPACLSARQGELRPIPRRPWPGDPRDGWRPTRPEATSREFPARCWSTSIARPGQPTGVRLISTLNSARRSDVPAPGSGPASYPRGSSTSCWQLRVRHRPLAQELDHAGPIQRGFQAPEAVKMLLGGNQSIDREDLLQLPEKVELQPSGSRAYALTALEGACRPISSPETSSWPSKLEPNPPSVPVIAYYLGKLAARPAPRGSRPPRPPNPFDGVALAAPRDPNRREALSFPANPFATRSAQTRRTSQT